MKFRLRDVCYPESPRFPDVAQRQLGMIVAKDYERRMKRERPDRWHWADALLFLDGWIVEAC